MGSTTSTYGAAEESGDEYGGATAMLAAYARKLGPHLQKHSRSGTMSAATGAISVLRGLRTIRRGRKARGLFQLGFGLIWLGTAVVQRRGAGGRSDIDEADVSPSTTGDLDAIETDDDRGPDRADADEMATGTDLGDVDDIESGEDDGAEADDVDESEVVDTGADLDEVDEGETAEPDSS